MSHGGTLSSIRICGIDPGATGTHGVAIIDVLPSGRFEIEEYGWCATLFVLELIVANDCPVAIEKPKRVYGGMSPQKAIALANNLLDVRDFVDTFGELARDLGRRVLKLTPQEWRKAFTGRMAVNDPLVLSNCRLRCTNLPRRTNNHERDAMGVGWAAGMQLLREKR